MDYKRLEKQLEFLREADKAKSVFRNTILLDASRQENDAEHSWHMAICAMIFTEYLNEPVNDMGRLLQIIMLHDIIEIYAGDTFAYGTADELLSKNDRERAAADKLFSLLPEDQSKDFRSLWDEFEARITPESKCANLVDTFMPLYHNYITKGQKWLELGVTKAKVLARCSRMKDESDEIYNFACGIIADAVQKGYLPVE
jgi:putative hydrolase of HD superfamily